MSIGSNAIERIRRRQRWAKASAFVAGLLFSGGLVIGGMTQPSKVVQFLDALGGAWDPSLAFVMGGAIAVHAPFYALVIRRRSQPLLDEGFQVPRNRALTPALIGGSALFGIGWGLGGYCPGPALSSVPSLGLDALVFVATMSVGMVLHRLLTQGGTQRDTKAPRASRGSHADA